MGIRTRTSGIMTMIAPAPTTAAGYVGPGDVVSGAAAWWGLRAYTNSSIGSSAVRLRRDSDNAEQDFATIAGGGLDLTGISAFKGAANLFVTKLYDQVGTNHLSQPVAGGQPSFTLSGIGSLPIMTWASASTQYLVSDNTITQAQPFTFSLTANNTGTGAQSTIIGKQAGTQIQGGFNRSGANDAYIFAGSAVPTATQSDASWHAFQWVYNNASSDINVDGLANASNLGSSLGWAGSFLYFGQQGGSTEYYNGKAVELGFWVSAFSGANSTAMSANQHAYWGF